jgi:hypothetical protein
MVSAGLVTTVLELPDLPVHNAVSDPFAMRVPIGLATAATALVIS